MPMLDIRTVAAGGGSICRFDGMRLRVGPESAGAVPGPACYRRGGPLTVTDCNLMLGRLQPEFFPRVFGPGGDEAIDREIVVERFKALAAEIAEATGKPAAPEEIAEGCLVIAVENMARAIKQVSIERGHDVTGYTLNAFGGAAGQHACMVADRLGIKRVMIHPLAGLLSAYGIGLAEMRLMREQTVNVALEGAEVRLREAAGVLDRDARTRAGGARRSARSHRNRADGGTALRRRRRDADRPLWQRRTRCARRSKRCTEAGSASSTRTSGSSPTRSRSKQSASPADLFTPPRAGEARVAKRTRQAGRGASRARTRAHGGRGTRHAALRSRRARAGCIRFRACDHPGDQRDDDRGTRLARIGRRHGAI